MDVASNPRAPRLVLLLQRSPTSLSTIIVCPDGHTENPTPLFLVEVEPFARPSIQLYHGPGKGNALAGETRSSHTTPNNHLMVNDRLYTLNTAPTGNRYSLAGSPVGELIWVKIPSPGQQPSMELVDLWERSLARLVSCDATVGRLEIYEECSDFSLELVILSCFAVIEADIRYV